LRGKHQVEWDWMRHGIACLRGLYTATKQPSRQHTFNLP